MIPDLSFDDEITKIIHMPVSDEIQKTQGGLIRYTTFYRNKYGQYEIRITTAPENLAILCNHSSETEFKNPLLVMKDLAKRAKTGVWTVTRETKKNKMVIKGIEIPSYVILITADSSVFVNMEE